MKIGFSTLACPSWDLTTVVAKAGEYGYDGVELRGIKGNLDLTRVPEVSANPGATRQLFASANVELVCLGSSISLDARDRSALARSCEELTEYIDLAAELACPYVRIFVGEAQKGEVREATIARIAESLTGIAPYAGDRKVTILVENVGDFSGSASLWHLCDYASHPAIRACWNICNAVSTCERPTVSIPRLGTKIGMVHICDGVFDEQGYLEQYHVPGEGNVELARAIDLLKGVYFCDYLMFEWPKLWNKSIAPADDVLPRAATFLRGCVDNKQAILSAYKGDKNPAKMEAAPAVSPARPV